MHLVLNSYGTSLKKENGLFVISTQEGKQSLSPRDVKTISISKGARISSDAVLLAIENQIDILFLDGTGMPMGRVWSIKYGSISDIRQKQIEFLYSDKCLPWVKRLIAEKINNQIALLLTFKPEDQHQAALMIKQTINSLEDYKLKVGSAEGVIVADVAPSLRGWEGLSAKKYFKCLSVLLPEPYQFEKRSHNPAADEFNAALNYGYGILYGKIESSLIKAGIDPYVGIFHRDDYNRPALVFDIIEKFRIWIDYVIVQLFLQMAFSDECFVKNETMCYLDGLGKRIVIQSINDYLGEIILLNKLERSRAVHIDLYANSLAQEFLKHN